MPNVLFARHKLATRKQQPRETFEKNFFLLRLLSKDCDLKAVTAEEYRNELVRDAFINGILSHSTHQRLFETNRLTVNQAFDKACSFRTVQRHSEAYFNPVDTAVVVSLSTKTKSICNQANVKFVLNSTISLNICAFYGFLFHNRKQCLAKEVTCYTCGKKGYFIKVCRSKSFQKILGSSNSISKPLLIMWSMSASFPQV